jgi:predicted dehydrogenase
VAAPWTLDTVRSVKKLTVSVVGGGAGGRLSLEAAARSERYELMALADLRPEIGRELNRKFAALQFFADYREMFRVCPTDVVCVSTYPPSHEEVAVEALSLPLKAILVEKPLGHCVASGRRILQAVKQRNIPMATPHGLMVKRCSLEIIERIQNGEIGELKLIEIQSPAWDIINAGIHWLNFAVNLNGRIAVESVLAACDKTTRTFRDGMQVETVAVTYVKMVNGVRIVMHSGDTVRANGRRDPETVTFRIIGTHRPDRILGLGAGLSSHRCKTSGGNTHRPRGTSDLAASTASGEFVADGRLGGTGLFFAGEFFGRSGNLRSCLSFCQAWS